MEFKIFLSSEMTFLREVRFFLKNGLEKRLRYLNACVTGIDFDSGDNRDSTMGDCLNLLAEADLFIGLVGNRAGSYNDEGFTGSGIEFETALRLSIPKILVDCGPAGVRDSESSLLLDWMEASAGAYFQKVACQTKEEILEKISLLVGQGIPRRVYLRTESKRLSHIGPIGHFNFNDHMTDFRSAYNGAVIKGNLGAVLNQFQYILSFIRKELNSKEDYLKNPVKHTDFLTECANSLKLFADCYNYVQFTGKLNRPAVWCAEMASSIYWMTGNLALYKHSLSFRIHNLYSMASKQKTDYRKIEKEQSYARKTYLLKAKTYSDYLYYLEQRTAHPHTYHSKLALSDGGYSGFIIRELGNPDLAAETFVRWLKRHTEAHGTSFFHLAELTYTQSISSRQNGFKKNLEELEGYYPKAPASNYKLIVGKRMMETYANIGEQRKALTMYEELVTQAKGLGAYGDLIKINKRRAHF